jgi:hypothetical protein
MVCNNALRKGLGYVLMQHGKVITYTLKQLWPYKVNYLVHDLKPVVVVFAFKEGFGVLKRRSVMAKGLRSAQQVSSSSQGVHLL